MKAKRIRILYVVTEDWLFCLHRFDVARLARDKGFEVMVATRVGTHGQSILDEGFTLFPMEFVRGLQSPVKECRIIWALASLIKHEKPDIVHHIALKSMMYGYLASWFVRTPAVVNSVTGLGHVFSGTTWKILMIRKILKTVLRLALRKENSLTIFQNPDDQQTFCDLGLITKQQSVVIKGSGVDIEKFCPAPPKEGTPVILLGCRLLWEKGVGEYVEAAKLLKEKGVKAVCALAGMLDSQNPEGISETQIRQWEQEGAIEWWGFLENMSEVLPKVHVVVLPSYYGEGVPKFLLEGAACGRPVITTDIRGCREAVRHGKSGLLVPPKNVEALAEAMESLACSPSMRDRMGQEGRSWVVRDFSSKKVARETIEVYDQLLEAMKKQERKETLCPAGKSQEKIHHAVGPDT
ncbi:MAG: glycosyltransferase family 4 protein [Nitrospirales bacterium]|nr:glycosyltransferase family 4 protein [Nitrospirales bacterium]